MLAKGEVKFQPMELWIKRKKTQPSIRSPQDESGLAKIEFLKGTSEHELKLTHKKKHVSETFQNVALDWDGNQALQAEPQCKLQSIKMHS